MPGIFMPMSLSVVKTNRSFSRGHRRARLDAFQNGSIRSQLHRSRSANLIERIEASALAAAAHPFYQRPSPTARIESCSLVAHPLHAGIHFSP